MMNKVKKWMKWRSDKRKRLSTAKALREQISEMEIAAGAKSQEVRELKQTVFDQDETIKKREVEVRILKEEVRLLSAVIARDRSRVIAETRNEDDEDPNVTGIPGSGPGKRTR